MQNMDLQWGVLIEDNSFDQVLQHFDDDSHAQRPVARLVAETEMEIPDEHPHESGS